MAWGYDAGRDGEAKKQFTETSKEKSKDTNSPPLGQSFFPVAPQPSPLLSFFKGGFRAPSVFCPRLFSSAVARRLLLDRRHGGAAAAGHGLAAGHGGGRGRAGARRGGNAGGADGERRGASGKAMDPG